MKNCIIIEKSGSTYFSPNVSVEGPFVNLEKPLSKSNYFAHVSEEKSHKGDYWLEYGSPVHCEILKIPASMCKIYVLNDKELPKWISIRYEDAKRIEKERKAEFLRKNVAPASADKKPKSEHKKKF